MQPSDAQDTCRWRDRLIGALETALPAGLHAPSENRPIAEHGLAARRAGVLMPVVAADEPYVYFTQRSAKLRHHPGQISFPGGSVEPQDANARAAALREADEEIDLDPGAVEILGELPEYRTVTGFVVSPFVGWVDAAAPVAPDDAEVARLFAVPLAYALDPTNFSRYGIERDGRIFEVYALDYAGDHIWGATAGMLFGLVQRLAVAEGRPVPSPQYVDRPRSGRR